MQISDTGLSHNNSVRLEGIVSIELKERPGDLRSWMQQNI